MPLRALLLGLLGALLLVHDLLDDGLGELVAGPLLVDVNRLHPGRRCLRARAAPGRWAGAAAEQAQACRRSIGRARPGPQCAIEERGSRAGQSTLCGTRGRGRGRNARSYQQRSLLHPAAPAGPAKPPCVFCAFLTIHLRCGRHSCGEQACRPRQGISADACARHCTHDGSPLAARNVAVPLSSGAARPCRRVRLRTGPKQ